MEKNKQKNVFILIYIYTRELLKIYIYIMYKEKEINGVFLGFSMESNVYQSLLLETILIAKHS